MRKLISEGRTLLKGKTVLVYPDPTSKKRQPPGIFGLEPALVKVMGWKPIGKVKIPSSSGVRVTPVSELEGW